MKRAVQAGIRLFLLANVVGAGTNFVRAANVPSTQPTASTSVDLNAAIAHLIAQLGDDDPAARDAASAALRDIGLPARPQLTVACHDVDPEIASLATQLLLQLTWTADGDSDALKQLLANYGTREIDQRKAVALQIGQFPDDSGFDALLRLLKYDPSDSVRWTVVGELRMVESPAKLLQLRQLEPAENDPPMLAISGFAWSGRDAAKSLERFHQALTAINDRPCDEPAELSFVYDGLVGHAIELHDYNAAASLLRQQIALGSPADEDGIPTALFDLFALQADYGPLSGFDQDQQQAGPRMADRKIQYCLAHMQQRLGNLDAARKIGDAAFAAGVDSRDRYYIGMFLTNQGWNDAAERELNAALTPATTAPVANGTAPVANGTAPAGSGGGDGANGDGGAAANTNLNGGGNGNGAAPDASPDVPPEELLVNQVNVKFALARLASQRGDDLRAAQLEQQAMEAQTVDQRKLLAHDSGNGHERLIPENSIWADIHWHYLRAARDRHDNAQIALHLNELVRLGATDVDIVCDAVPLLDQSGRRADATAMFDAAYQLNRQALDADPQDPQLQNDLAWLCACCNRHAREALALATNATAADPDNAAYLDTLAHALFQSGQSAKAADVERKALSLEPGDPFMSAEVARFSAAATQP